MDLDGTLEDSRADMVAAANRVRAMYGLSNRPFDEMAPHVMRGMEHLYRNCLPELFVDEAADGGARLREVEARYVADYGAHIADATSAYPGIPEALEALAARADIVVYTNKPEGLSRALLTRLDLISFVRLVIGADTYPECKPAVGPMQQAARALEHNARLHRSCFVGDSAGDMQAAAAFGALSIWCAWGYYDAPPTNPSPDRIAERAEQLISIVETSFLVQ